MGLHKTFDKLSIGIGGLLSKAMPGLKLILQSVIMQAKVWNRVINKLHTGILKPRNKGNLLPNTVSHIVIIMDKGLHKIFSKQHTGMGRQRCRGIMTHNMN